MLTCTPRLEGSRLELNLAIENPLTAAIWVADSLPVPAGSGVTSSSRAAYVRPYMGGVLISREYLPVPEHLDVEAPERPEWVRVEPGEVHRCTLELPWPLVARDPYDAKALAAPGPSRKLWCGLGYVVDAGRGPPRDPKTQSRAVVELKGLRHPDSSG